MLYFLNIPSIKRMQCEHEKVLSKDAMKCRKLTDLASVQMHLFKCVVLC